MELIGAVDGSRLCQKIACDGIGGREVEVGVLWVQLVSEEDGGMGVARLPRGWTVVAG